MNLYLISDPDYSDRAYDTYESAVVAAESAHEAAKIHPSGGEWTDRDYSWCDSPEKVEVTLIGTAAADINAGEVILSSFNPG